MRVRRVSVILLGATLALGLGAVSLARAFGEGQPSAKTEAFTITLAPDGSPPPGVFVPRTYPYTASRNDAMWSNPTGDSGKQISPADLGEVGFTVDQPWSLGDANAIWFLDSSDLASREVWWVYADPSLGTILLREEIAYEDQADLEAPALASPGCTIVVEPDGSTSGDCNPSGYSLEQLADGTKALVAKTDSLSMMKWLEPLDDATQTKLGSSGPASLELTIFVHAATTQDLVSLANKV